MEEHHPFQDSWLRPVLVNPIKTSIQRAFEKKIPALLEGWKPAQLTTAILIPEASTATVESSALEISAKDRIRRGPKPDHTLAQRFAEAVRRVAPSGSWRNMLNEVCSALDEDKVPVPLTWRKRSPPIRNWEDSSVGAESRDLARKAIAYRLRQAKPRTVA
jgi:hypothetical protein